MTAPSPALVLYSKPGCGLCVETRQILDALLAERAAKGLPAPALQERDITTNDAWERAYFLEIPVGEGGERRLALATAPARLRRFLADTLDSVTA